MKSDELKQLAEHIILTGSQPTKEQLLDMSTYEMYQLEMYVKRLKYKYTTDNILACIKSDLNRPFKATFSKKHFKVNVLLNHDFENAEYYFGKTTHLLYVVIDGNVIKTCYNNDGGRFKMK